MKTKTENDRARTSRPNGIFVHFGVHKTGSSSIQETLFVTRHSLPDVVYLTNGTRANSSLVVRNAFQSETRLAAMVGPGREPAALRRHGLEQFNAMCVAAGAAGRAILSAETISHFDATALAQLNGVLAAHWSEISYVGYVREPVSYTRSAFQQRLKNKIGQGFPFAEGMDLKGNYHLVVERLDAQVGREAVNVFPFERDLFPQGDVVRHFLDVVGLADAEIQVRRVNEGLSATAVKALYCYRRLRVATDTEIGHNPSRAAFIAAVSAIDGPALVLHPEVEARIAAANAHILEWSETRLGRRLRLPTPAADGEGVRDEADLMRFTDDEMAELARWASTQGLAAPAGRAGSEGVADLVADLRLRLAASPQA